MKGVDLWDFCPLPQYTYDEIKKLEKLQHELNDTYIYILHKAVLGSLNEEI